MPYSSSAKMKPFHFVRVLRFASSSSQKITMGCRRVWVAADVGSRRGGADETTASPREPLVMISVSMLSRLLACGESLFMTDRVQRARTPYT